LADRSCGVDANRPHVERTVAERIAAFPCSGEINFTVDDTELATQGGEAFSGKSLEVTELDGLSMAFDDWRFNLRASNAEPLLRLNVEARGDSALVDAMTKRISAMVAR
jgi:phosphomannomutase